MQELYLQYEEWLLEPLRRDLPAYIHYRNYVRGHRALGGRPSITRLREQDRIALPWVLDHLSSYASYEVARKIMPPSGSIRLFSRDAYLDAALGGSEVAFHETLEGLEARVEGQPIAILRDYRSFRQLPNYRHDELPPTLLFEKYDAGRCPRMAVAL
jgi:hypothetical protein